MLPDPLHPALVHFPIVFMTILPVVAAVALWLIHRGSAPRRAWAVPVATAAALTLTAWLSIQTGEGQEDKVEAVVPKAALETHEEAADLFLIGSIGVLALAGAGLAAGRIGRAARIGAAVGAVALGVAGFRVGHSGGELVYRHGASAAYTSGTSAAAAGEVTRDRESDDDDDE